MWRPESGVKNLCKICQLIETYDAIVEDRKCSIFAHVFVNRTKAREAPKHTKSSAFGGGFPSRGRYFMMRQSALKIK